jgi:hypothetical protein
MPQNRSRKSKTPTAADLAPDSVSYESISLEADLVEATGTKVSLVQWQLLKQVVRTMSFPEGPNEQPEQMRTAVGLLLGVKPRGELEGMLAVQMVAVHSIAMECFRRAVLPDQAGEKVDMYLRHGERLLAIFASLSAALDKHRSKAPSTLQEMFKGFRAIGPQE